MQNKLKIAEQFRRALLMFAQSIPEEKAIEIPCIYESWSTGKQYVKGEILKYGENSVGDPQLYKVVQNHVSQSDWLPSDTPSLYTPIGIDNDGFPTWSQPTGAHDAYNIGDIVNYNGTLYKSLINGNVYSPDAYPQGWEIYTEA